ncbi:MAG: hypothetical protein ACQERX_06000 [Bacillota bacterium]
MTTNFEKNVGITIDEAKEYLKEIGRLNEFSKSDGFSLVLAAKKIMKRRGDNNAN